MAGDRNGDKNLDLTALSIEEGATEIGRALGDGTGKFPDCSVSFSAGLSLSTVGRGTVSADVNEDGFPDFLVMTASGQPPDATTSLVLFLSDGDQYDLEEAIGAVDNRSGMVPVTVGDLDRDSHQDLIFGGTRTWGAYLQVHRGDGMGRFDFFGELTLPAEDTGILVPMEIQAASLNSDASLDLVVHYRNSRADFSSIRVYLGDDLASPVSEWRADWEIALTRFEVSGIGISDFTKDGLLDLLVYGPGRGEHEILVYQAVGNGTFTGNPLEYLVGFPFVPREVTADFDEDGHEDLLLLGEVMFQVRLSSESFEDPHHYWFRIQTAPSMVDVGDFDGDGHMDLILPDRATEEITDGRPGVLLIRGGGDGTFQTPAALGSQCGQYGYGVVSDLDEDGSGDLVASLNYSISPIDSPVLGPCVLLRRRGAREAPFFELAASHPPSVPNLASGGGAAATADFDSDGHRDVASGGCVFPEFTPGFAIRFGDGTGLLGEPAFFQHVRSDSCASPISSEDFNDDGYADLLILGRAQGAKTFSSYLGNGDGRRPPCLAACDADGDGSVVGQVTDAVYILRFNFAAGSPPVRPFPECGLGEPGTDELLGCKEPPGACR